MTNTSIDLRRQQMAGDPHRPLYHFLPPSNWMNDPNGAIFWKGKYHLFYQHNPNGPFPDRIHWGHAVSEDLVHWADLPIAIAPEEGGPDEIGCWSGGAVDNNGVPTLIYYGNPGGICLATGDEEMVNWKKCPENPVIPAPAEGTVEWRPHDPCAWKEGDTWYSLSGSYVGHPPKVIGASRDAAFMFRSPDLIHWEYMGLLYELGEEGDCAVPDFFPLGDKHMLLFASHTRGGQYYIGSYANQRFTPEHHGRLNFTTFDRTPGASLTLFTSGDLIAPISWGDASGRRVMIAWIAEGRTEAAQRASGWAGILSLPRVLSLNADGTLRIEPLPDLQSLRADHRRFTDLPLAPAAFQHLDEVQGDCLEISAVLEPQDAEAMGLKLRRSPGGEEETLVLYKPAESRIELDVTRSSLDASAIGRETQGTSLELASGEPLELRIFLDRSVVEVFVNSRLCLTKRIYPSRPDSLGVGLLAHGGIAMLRSMDVWKMNAIWPR